MSDHLFRALREAQTGERSRVGRAAKEWADSINAEREALRLCGIDDQTVTMSQAASEALTELPRLGLLKSVLLSQHLADSRSTAHEAIVKRIEDELDHRIQIADLRRKEYDDEEDQKTYSIEFAKENKRKVVEAVNAQRQALDNTSDSIQMGCTVGMVVACVSLLGYLGYNFLMSLLGKPTHNESPIIVLFLILFVVPISVTLLGQFFFGAKRLMVEAELASRIKHADSICEKAIEAAEGRFSAHEVILKQNLREAIDEVDRFKAALHLVKGESDSTPSEQSAAGNV